ncbi:uncharacterized protein A4U43_C09F4920 [Asparagus officinalis]|uniref:Uncharacterized protein n=1 Tax=Asparagus officinalis TaxID=4686 RepID=A0A5P1E8Q8_ASPOF|nr:uncharacterized protein A4U43_C09F4920 [Asparagus officinalis]
MCKRKMMTVPIVNVEGNESVPKPNNEPRETVNVEGNESVPEPNQEDREAVNVEGNESVLEPGQEDREAVNEVHGAHSDDSFQAAICASINIQSKDEVTVKLGFQADAHTTGSSFQAKYSPGDASLSTGTSDHPARYLFKRALTSSTASAAENSRRERLHHPQAQLLLSPSSRSTFPAALSSRRKPARSGLLLSSPLHHEPLVLWNKLSSIISKNSPENLKHSSKHSTNRPRAREITSSPRRSST